MSIFLFIIFRFGSDTTLGKTPIRVGYYSPNMAAEPKRIAISQLIHSNYFANMIILILKVCFKWRIVVDYQ